MSPSDIRIYVMSFSMGKGHREYGGYSNSNDFNMGPGINEPWAFLEGVLEPPKKRRTCRLPLGLPAPLAIMSMDVVVPILTQDVAQIWTNNRLTGWEGTPVALYDEKKKQDLGTGVAVSVLGRCGGLKYGPMLPGSKATDVTTYHRGIFPDMSAWDGSDLFLTGPKVTNALIFTTERLKEVTEKAGIIGVEFAPIDEFEALRSNPDWE